MGAHRERPQHRRGVRPPPREHVAPLGPLGRRRARHPLLLPEHRGAIGADRGDARHAARRGDGEPRRPHRPGIRHRLHRRRHPWWVAVLGVQRGGFVDRRGDLHRHGPPVARGAEDAGDRPTGDVTARRLTLSASESGVRVDRYVAEHSQLSRSALTRLAKEGHVRIGDAPVEAGHRVKRGDEIVVDIPPDAPALSLEAEDIPIEVVYEDGDVIVVNKPADLVVHPAYGHSSGTLVNALVGRIGAQSGREASRPGIVHRLDKDTSGVMIIAKNDVAQLALARQIQGRTVKKEYVALVWGDPGAEPAVVEAPLLRDPNDRRRMVVRAGGRDAVTRFRRIAAYGDGADRQ
ncbi:MAG: RluA family pseudouridine synthase, partial [Chloroflexi bacterium]|nr:RluA family pseudouridine synthase [Chloroflexota bacterium]